MIFQFPCYLQCVTLHNSCPHVKATGRNIHMVDMVRQCKNVNNVIKLPDKLPSHGTLDCCILRCLPGNE